MIAPTPSPILSVRNLSTYLAGQYLHRSLNFDVAEREILAIIGSSGTGKTCLLETLLMLNSPMTGSIKMLGQELVGASAASLRAIQRHIGVMFQNGALFTSMTVLENIVFPLEEHYKLDKQTIDELAFSKMTLVGLSSEVAHKYPAELSGGMLKRAAVARALALDPKLLFLDEPTAGLDPENAANLDQLILNLKTSLGLTIILITHDIDSLWRVTDRVAFLGEQKILELAPIRNLIQNPHPLIQRYFAGVRGRTAQSIYQYETKS